MVKVKLPPKLAAEVLYQIQDVEWQDYTSGTNDPGNTPDWVSYAQKVMAMKNGKLELTKAEAKELHDTLYYMEDKIAEWVETDAEYPQVIHLGWLNTHKAALRLIKELKAQTA